MTSSSAVPPIAGDQSDSDEYEYEEIEIEEEIEVEEEVTDDEDDDVNDDERERTTTIVSNDEKSFQCVGGVMTGGTTNHINEISKQVIASDKDPHSEEQTTQVNTKDVHDAQQKESRCTHFSMKACRRDQSVVLAEKNRMIFNDEKSSQYDGGIMTAETTNPLNECSKQVTASDKDPHSKEQSTQVNTKDSLDAQQNESRLDVVTLKKPRSLSPVLEMNNGNKRPAYACDFFAKGWCIKGSSCRFAHIKESTDTGAIQNTTQKSDEGLSEGTGSDMSISAGTIISCSSEIEPTSQKEITATILSSNDMDKVNPPVKADSSLHGPLSNPLMDFPNIHGSDRVSSYATKKEELGGKKYHFGLHNYNYNSSYHNSVWPRASANLSSSPCKSDSKFSSYDWQPSKPFRSAFLISQGISTPDIQFDPILTSTEPSPKIGDKSSKLSSSSRVPPVCSHSSVKEKLKTESGSDRFSIGSHVNGINVDSNDIPDTKQETTKSASKGKEHSGDVVQASEVHVSSHHSLRQNDGGPKKEANNCKLEFDAEGDMHRESKPLRHFRAALIEFVKELMRPTWLDGKLSKDAHKLIVKKAVDKVLTTLPPEQIPSVKESIDMYLTSSKTKLMRLVEGYIAKYGKI